MWTKKDNDFLRINYPTKTAGWCADHLKKSKVAIHLHVRVLGLSAVGRKGCRKTREILRKISEDFVICFCPKHDETEHKRSANGCVRCVLCGTENNAKRKGNRISTDHTRNLAKLLQRKRRSTQIAKYVDRLRSCLYQCGVGRISFSKHFPYGAK